MDLKRLTDKNNFEGCEFIKLFRFDTGVEVPLYDISTLGSLNQIIGHAKMSNANYGNVFYRGVDGLYDNVLPSIMRKRSHGVPADLNGILKKICNSEYFKNSIKLKDTIRPRKESDFYENKVITRHNKLRVEALLQHYAGKTRFLDVVDNHWVALWMGVHNFRLHGKGHLFCSCEKRVLEAGDIYDSIENKGSLKNNIYEYILLIAMPYGDKKPIDGISETEEFVTVDIRKALPSIYLRPHAQHALVVRRRDNNNNDARYYDLSSQVVGILRIRIDRASLWLGNGQLVTKDNLFPSPSIDQGYNNLLMHSDIFTNPFEIIKYY